MSADGAEPGPSEPSLREPGLSEDEAEAAYQAFIWRHLRRNYIGNYVHGMLGMTGFRLVNAPTFLPAYLHALSGSDALVGLGLGLQQLGAVVSPLIGAAHIEHRRRVMPTAMVMGTAMRVPILLMAIAGWTLHGPALLASLLVLLFFLGLFSGMQRVVFQLLMAKVIPIARRGRLQAWRNFTGGLIAAGLSYAAGRYLIQHDVLGNGYSTTFLIAFVLTSAGLTALRLLMIEPEPPTLRTAMPLRQRLREIPALVAANRDYRNFLIAQAFAMASKIGAPFYILHVAKIMTLSGAKLGLFSLAYLGADTVSNLLWGRLGDRGGFKSGFVISLALWIGATLLLTLSHATPWLMLAFCGLGAANSGYQLSSQTLVLEFGARDDVAMRLAVSSMVEGAVSAVGPLVGGLLAAVTGYPLVFAVTIVLQVVALVVLSAGVAEPRRAAQALAARQTAAASGPG